MSKQTPTVEWIVAESEAEWERLCPVPVLNLASERHRRLHLRRAFWCVTALLLLLASAISVSAPAPISPVAEKGSKPSAPDHWFLPGAVVSVPGPEVRIYLLLPLVLLGSADTSGAAQSTASQT